MGIGLLWVAGNDDVEVVEQTTIFDATFDSGFFRLSALSTYFRIASSRLGGMTSCMTMNPLHTLDGRVRSKEYTQKQSANALGPSDMR